ncbi:HD-GYP domain-containing protein [Desulfogranum japonicum]|uniref:HD-GYP domain-containing protein n=1 Tax=Desulfogranum japonicum TaxID=231447 RepID=UPI000420B4F9|nr:two-component system response regulator [Desulfogranum japonicum]
MQAEKQTVLVVDDTPENIDVLVGTLKDAYNVKAAINGLMGLKIARESLPDIILLDIMMPQMDGYEVCRRLKADMVTKNIPVIFITAKIGLDDELHGLMLGAVDYITKPISPPVVMARVKTHLALYDQNRELDRKVRLQTRQLHETRLQVIQRLGKAAEFKDNETGLHVIRVSKYAYILAKAMGLNETDSDLLMNAAPMHDIGKIGIPDIILKKPGKLTDDEFDTMKSHCAIGADVIGFDDSDLLRLAREIALTHHEKWNGRGYPHGLIGDNIPLPGRIVAITDVFDALTSDRPYKKAWPTDSAVELLHKEAGEHFDPQLIPLFIQSLPEIIKVKERYAETKGAT